MGTSSTTVVYEPGALVARKYRLLRPIGVGGMGAVWIARNETTMAEVALKTWHDNGKNDEAIATAERFRHEARLSALVTHRNIVQVFDLVDEPDGSLALVMELLRGESLDRYVATGGGKLEPVQAVAVLLPILSALGHAHRLGVVHRDVKPGNVFVTVDADGVVVPKLVDFGIAKAPAAGTSYTLEGDALGTPRYMAPEQIRNEKDIDGRADLFAVAVMLVELLTGVSPFMASSSAATLAAVLEREIDPDPAIPPALWVEISRALKKRPFERHANALEMSEGLRKALGVSDGEIVSALQSMAPSHDLVAPVAESVPTQLASESNVLPMRGRLGWALPVGAAAIALAIVGTVVLARQKASPPTASSAKQTVASAAPSSSAASAASAAANAQAAQTIAADPSPPTAPTSAPTASGVAGAPPELPPPRTAPRAPPKSPDRPAVPRSGGRKGVATTPGF